MKATEQAKAYIDGCISKSKLSYDQLMLNLAEKIEDWEGDKFQIDLINIFEQTDEETKRVHYLRELIAYGNKLIWENKVRSWRRKHPQDKVTTVTITGTNLKVVTS